MRRKGGKRSSLAFSNPETFVFKRSVIAEAAEEVAAYLTESATYWFSVETMCKVCFSGEERRQHSLVTNSDVPTSNL